MVARSRMTGSSPTAASPASPARRSSAGWRRGLRRRARTGAPTSSPCDGASATPTGRRSGPGDFRASMERYLRVTPRRVPALLHRDRRRTALHERVGALRPLAGHRVGSARADDHRPPDRARPGVPPQADAALRVRRACRHARASGTRTSPRPAPVRIASPLARAPRRRARPQRRTSGRPPRGRPASRIGSRSGVSRLGRLEAHAAAVERGSADVTWLGDLPPARPPPGAASRARRAGCTAVPAPGTLWMFLNVRRPPFDDLRVRQAINFATDRAALVERYGGPEAAAPTCQIVPPRSPASRPTVPTPPTRRAVADGPRRTRARPPTGRRVRPGRRDA